MDELENCDAGATAICGSYLMVAFADARYERIEEGRLMSTLLNDPALSSFNAAALQDCYNALTAAFRDDYAKATDAVISALGAIKDDAAIAAAVTKAARLAVVADQRILAQEEIAIDRIEAALGLESGRL